MAAEPPVWIFTNGRIITNNHDIPRAEAMVVGHEKIRWIGRREELPAIYKTGAVVRDLKGCTVLPGLIDAHLHVEGLGRSLEELNFVGSTSYEELIQMVAAAAAAAPPGNWIHGRGWDQNNWPESRMPDHRALSAVSPAHPVYLRRIDGHAALVNQKALDIGSITKTTAEPAGGRILKTSAGEVLGVLIDEAMSLVNFHIPAPAAAVRRRRVEKGLAECARYGLTMVHDAGADHLGLEIYQSLRTTNRLPIRAYVMIEGSEAGLLDEWLLRGPLLDSADRLIIRAVKLYADGALGSRGAALLEPYADEPGTRGLLMMEADSLETLLRRIHRAGFQCAVHAIGDRANHLLLDLYEKILGAEILGGKPGRDPRHRIEHAQIIAPGDIGRFAALGVVASMQFTHATSDWTWVANRIGRGRLPGAYAWRSISRAGARLAQGSDAPIESPNPFPGLAAGISRQDADGNPKGGWLPHECLTPAEALGAATTGAAQAAFLEDRLGRLQEGCWADFVLCDTDPLTEPASSIRKTQVEETWVGGKCVYRRG
ncbi:MAG: amidohydrolase [Candidatus Eisenbacteria bacterium]|uniref:Amidohydrolase n=1 Tax=Eiseniibacteriota bacterium TaxID=2212470 RepID=A0A948S082_UNCEI|nr:amidohydrolase [Candidatus Eisenbacteria bacterium]MBU2692867.1 amidohydrolase [Candidatus Eisenbacteria bacterium]